MSRRTSPIRLLLLVSAAFGSIAGSCSSAAPPEQQATAHAPMERINPYQARFGRKQPVIAIVGINSGTELTDYVIPFGILRQAEVGEIVTVATEAGPMTMRPALRIRPAATIADFDARFPGGADYVVVPAVVRRDDPVLIGWLRAQAAKGGTLVSICDGALVLAKSGLLDGHRATAHWATAGYRRKTYPAVRWQDDRRYVSDGKIVSSADSQPSRPPWLWSRRSPGAIVRIGWPPIWA